MINAEGPPVPIPNTEVKLCRAEDTQLATARENRYTPTQSGKPKRFPVLHLFYGSNKNLGDLRFDEVDEHTIVCSSKARVFGQRSCDFVFLYPLRCQPYFGDLPQAKLECLVSDLAI